MSLNDSVNMCHCTNQVITINCDVSKLIGNHCAKLLSVKIIIGRFCGLYIEFTV